MWPGATAAATVLAEERQICQKMIDKSAERAHVHDNNFTYKTSIEDIFPLL